MEPGAGILFSYGISWVPLDTPFEQRWNDKAMRIECNAGGWMPRMQRAKCEEVSCMMVREACEGHGQG